MHRLLLALSLCILISACNNQQTTTKTLATDTTAQLTAHIDTATLPPITDSDEYARLYILVTDTALDYHSLDAKMYALSKATGLEIDTMDRYYNSKKNSIVLSENDEDEMYRGEYFPRRYTSATLSLDYLSFYRKNTTDKTIALVAGIYETQREADSALNTLRKSAPATFGFPANVYIACMH